MKTHIKVTQIAFAPQFGNTCAGATLLRTADILSAISREFVVGRPIPDQAHTEMHVVGLDGVFHYVAIRETIEELEALING